MWAVSQKRIMIRQTWILDSALWIPDFLSVELGFQTPIILLKAGFGIRLVVLQVPIPGFLVGLCTNIFFSILVRQKH